MGLALFYHLTRTTLEETVPTILSRAIGAGWRVLVRGTDPGRIEWLDQRLWTDRDDSFLPHGLKGGPHDGLQPVLLTADPGPPPDDVCLMSVDGADVHPEECEGRERVWILFDGNDPAALAAARNQWTRLTAAGITAQYWSEDSGRWQMKAEK